MARNKLGITAEVPSRHFPWQQILLISLVAIFVVGGSVVAGLSQTLWKSQTIPGPPAPPAQVVIVPAEPTLTPAPPPTPTATPVVKEWPKVEVVWQEVQPEPGVYLFNPIEDDGFYSGTKKTLEGKYKGESYPTPEKIEYIDRILPHLKSRYIIRNVAAARDRIDKSIVFVSIDAYDNWPSIAGTGRAKYYVYLLLSVDGGRSWYELNLPPGHFFEYDSSGRRGQATGGPDAVRVRVEGNSVYLIAKDLTVEEKWWAATIKKNELPVP